MYFTYVISVLGMLAIYMLMAKQQELDTSDSAMLTAMVLVALCPVVNTAILLMAMVKMMSR